MDHGLGIERRVQQDLLRLARDLGLPLVATNDLHYTRAEDAQAHAVLLCVQSGSTLADPKRFKFDAEDFYLKSPQEMRQVWRELPEACDNTLAIAESCEVEFTEGANLMPRFPVPEGESEQSWFVKEVEHGLHRRYPHGIPEDVRKQADYEVDVICQMGFPGYFLVVADFINWAKSQGIRVGPGRGSAAGSLAAYVTGITDLDPLPHGLIFERFLNPERVSMPDVDVDFDERRRGEVIKYVTEKYGEERVAQIVTYGTIKAKQALKDASRVLGYPFSMGERLTKAMPQPVMGKDIPLSGIFDREHPRYAEAEEFRQLHAGDPEVQKVVETARGLENLKRQWGVHAAGVIMSSEPLIDHIPIMRREQDGAIITQFDYPTCETLGLLKMDFLGPAQPHGHRRRAEEHRGQRQGGARPRGDLARPRRQRHLRAARARRHPRRLPARRRADALTAAAHAAGQLRGHLRRPRALPAGPDGARLAHELRAAQERAAGDHTDPPRARRPLAEILDSTHGLIVYQEAGHRHRQKVAGYSLGKATCCAARWARRSARSSTRRFEGFSAGMRANGYSEAAIKTLWDILVPFSDYASTRRTPRGTASSRTGPPTSRRTTSASTWRRCSPASATTRTSRRSTSTSAAGWDQGSSPPTSTPRPRTSARSATTSASV
jgi:DNA polymerase-3 subunit alpha